MGIACQLTGVFCAGEARSRRLVGSDFFRAGSGCLRVLLPDGNAMVMSDDPISMDAWEHFADGFPFLLAPLAQVKGASLPVMSSQTKRFSGKRQRGLCE